MDKILNYGDVVEIGRFFHKSDYDRLDIDMFVYVKSKEDLRKVNEDFYYRNAKDEEREELPADYNVDEVAVNISDTFKIIYRVKEEGEQEVETTTETPAPAETTTTTKKKKATSTTTKKAKTTKAKK